MTRVLRCLLLPLVLAGCSLRAAPGGVLLSFLETGPDGEQPVRMLVTAQFLRIEDGGAQDGYILFDRRSRTVYSVSHSDQTTLVVRAVPVRLAPPTRFENSVQRDSARFPAVDGRTVAHYQLMTNGERCFDVYAADGLLSEALAALREYHEALAGVQAETQARMPATYQSGCDLADLVFLPARHLQYGFPVRQVNREGVTRQLIDFKTGVPVEGRLLELPAGYREIAPGSVRSPGIN